jgi:hypothetical protein
LVNLFSRPEIKISILERLTPPAGRRIHRCGDRSLGAALRRGALAAGVATAALLAAARLELAKATELTKSRKVALLCFEADHRGCHRHILAERIQGELHCEVVNL